AGRMQIDWRPPGPVARRDVKLAFLALLCLESALPRGGHVTIEVGRQDWSIRAESDRLLIDKLLWGRITGGTAGQPLAPAHVQFALFADEARRQGRMARLALTDRRIELVF
ncbi:MAG: histidine phosphotransferase family protein, partial [Rhodobacteraceae bacterium]|nr:histidine phosphotransferase family protein [Paracoccaceae bacterium]